MALGVPGNGIILGEDTAESTLKSTKLDEGRVV